MLNKKIILSILTGIVFTLVSCEHSGTKDSDSQDIKIEGAVRIGKQVWMTTNLNVSSFRNGEFIPEAKTAEEWLKAGENKQSAWCYYGNDSLNGKKYGKLYNWFAVNDPRRLAPSGWHVASDADWVQLSDFLGGKSISAKLKNKEGWKEDGNGTNEVGFSSLPGGARVYNGDYIFGDLYGMYWTSTEHNATLASFRSMYYWIDDMGSWFYPKRTGFAVRCVRD